MKVNSEMVNMTNVLLLTLPASLKGDSNRINMSNVFMLRLPAYPKGDRRIPKHVQYCGRLG
jgi:hypothetical protein